MHSRNFIKNEKAASMVEMALLIALVSVIAIPAIRTTGRHIRCQMCATAIVVDNGNAPSHAHYRDYCLNGWDTMAMFGAAC